MNKEILGAIFISLILATLPSSASAATDDALEFGASIYGWFPNINGKTAVADDIGSDGFEIAIDDILKNLEFTFMGTLDARNGRWGVVTDVIYMSLGNSGHTSAEGTIGDTEIPVGVRAEVDFDLKSWIWNTAGYYRAIETENRTFDVLAGFRLLDVEQKIDWELTGNVGDIPLPGRAGSSKPNLSNWDFIIGLRGRFAFGQNGAWFVPYYLDMGTGDSDFTWQAAGGLGYEFGWGELTAVWRYLSYDLDSGSAIDDMSFSGPAAGATFRW